MTHPTSARGGVAVATRHAAVVVLVVAMAGGCASYTRSKIDLVEQGRRGVALVRESNDARRRSTDAQAAQRRAQLDAAFDADVAARARANALTSDWITAHRKAYALGLDALTRERRAADEARAATGANLDAVDAVLQQLQQMHAHELQFSIPEVKR